ncbi:tRNA (guanosine(46)-N7)-methyltransferase TrmB [Synechococcus sp. PCC 7336]|uniref:tRNA (guanosine(46)-N7)-methyltransferase TrmB n=1 Tax=Synechococcus sp. PCC 7336 TaxID=195250 RepID=UPI0003450C6E|nr:tRNA (guanosine(46)-N7)-methyltransferase TrmB [Synechococcus sp. PCC 7336]
MSESLGRSAIAPPSNSAALGSNRPAAIDWPLKGSAPLRVRNHVNPLNIQYQTPAAPPHWERDYARLDRPFHLDIGTGSGRFLLTAARYNPDWNFLGVEIRRPLVERANAWVQDLGLDNLHFLACNINVTLPHLFAPEDLARVSIQFPDPWFKSRHHKRRVVQPQLVNQLACLLQPGGTVFLQSDIEAVAVEMEARFADHPAFENTHGPHVCLDCNPWGISSFREQSCLAKGLPIYRYELERRR